jgi:hypothetical protein
VSRDIGWPREAGVAQIYNIDQNGCTEEDFLYVAPVANESGTYAAVVLYHGQLGPYFTSRVSLAEVKKQGDAWIAKTLNGATTSFRRDI